MILAWFAVLIAFIAIKIIEGLFWLSMAVVLVILAGIIGAIMICKERLAVRFAHARFDAGARAAADVPQHEVK